MRRALRHLLGAAGVVAVGIGALGLTADAQELDACANHTTFSVLGAASAVQTTVSFPGRANVGGAEGSLPGAQAAVDSVIGSKGWAGAPYVPVVAESAGLAGRDANDVPVFAVSEHPVTPEASKSTPAFNLSAKSSERSSTARAQGGGPETDQVGAGRSIASTAASCADDGSLHANADTSVDVTDVAGVLRIGSVRSHAEAVRDASGQLKKLDGTIAIEGVTILGQSVAIGDKGLVVGPSVTPLADNPLIGALESAGITVHYLAPTTDREDGEVLAPGLEISVAAPVPDGEPVTTTYVFGRALARASLTPGDAVPAGGDDFAAPVDAGSSPLDLPSTDVAVLPSGSDGLSTPAAAGRTAATLPTALPTAQLASWSVAPAYSALGVGVLLLLAWLLFEKIAVRFPWR